MDVKKIFPLLVLAFILNYSQMVSQDQAQKDSNENRIIEKFLYEYYTRDLLITDVVVRIDKEIVAISGTPDFRDRGKAIGQLVLAMSGAGIAAPHTRDICFTIQIQGMPLGFIEVLTRNALLASEGKITPEAFISSFSASQLSLPFDFPKDLLIPILKSADIWEDTPIIECSGGEIGELLKINIENFLPEFLHAAYIKTGPPDGSQVYIAAVIDFENVKEAKEFIGLNENNLMNKKFYRIGTLIYIIKGTDEIIKMGMASLKPGPEISIPPAKVSNDIKDLAKGKVIVIGAGFIILMIMVIAIFIISGKM